MNPSGPDTPGPHTSDNPPGPQRADQGAVNAPHSTPDPAATVGAALAGTSGSGPVSRPDGAVLLDRVRGALARYVVLPSDPAAVAVTLWIAASHVQPAWAHAPRLVVRGPEKRCGKSRLLDVVEALSWRPFLTVNSSPAAVYRSISDDPPTLLVDEADTIFGPKADGNEDLRGLLNAGHQRNRPAMRYDVNTARVEAIPTFAFAALAGIGSMPDTIEDRAVIVRMRRRAPGETVAPYRHRRDRPALRQLADELHRWLRADRAVLETATPVMPVEDRAADTWEPLIAVADHAGGTWPDRARRAVLALTEEGQRAEEDSERARLLADIHAAFGDADAMSTVSLLRKLREDPEAPWTEYGGPAGLTPRRLAILLSDYGIRSATIRMTEGQAKGFHRHQFTDAWRRYAPQLSDGDRADEADGPDEGTPGTRTTRTKRPTPGQGRYESEPRYESTRTSDDPGTSRPVPAEQPVPPLTCDGTLGTGGTGPRGLRVITGGQHTGQV